MDGQKWDCVNVSELLTVSTGFAGELVRINALRHNQALCDS